MPEGLQIDNIRRFCQMNSSPPDRACSFWKEFSADSKNPWRVLACRVQALVLFGAI